MDFVGLSNVDVVKAVIAALAERDLERVLEFAAPEIEFIAVTSDYAGRTGPYRGHDGIRQYFRDVAEVWDELRRQRALAGAGRIGLDRLGMAGARRQGRSRAGICIGGGRRRGSGRRGYGPRLMRSRLICRASGTRSAHTAAA